MNLDVAEDVRARGGEGRVERPVVVVTASNGFTLRNYVLGGCAGHLTGAGAHVVALSWLADDPGFVGAMAELGIEVRPVHQAVRDPSWIRFESWRHKFHIAHIDTETWRLKRSPRHHDMTWPQRIRGTLMFEAVKALTGRRALRWMDQRASEMALRSDAAEAYRAAFADLRPTLVFSPAPVFREDWLPVQVARSMGIRTGLGVLSWDNLSSKNRMPVPVDGILVWNERMRRELLAFYPDVPPASVHVVGAPQFDFYVRDGYRETREAFFHRIGADPTRRLVVYGGVTPSLMPNEPAVVAGLAEAIGRGEVRDTPNLLVRLHPKDDGARYWDFARRFPAVLFSTPGAESKGELAVWRPDEDAARLLVNTMVHGDVHINTASTMTLDAAVVDRPVINTYYDLLPTGSRRSWGLLQYECTHYQPIVESGAAPMAASPREMVSLVNRYLEDPRLERAERRDLVDLICGTVDGHAGERVGEALLGIAGSRQRSVRQ